MKKSIVIIGAGIVGVSAAIWLQRDGHNVTIIDKTGPAGGASFGNAGIVASSSITPVTMPGLVKAAPKMLFSPNEPLFLRWSYLPKLFPFLFNYLKHANTQSVERIADGLTQLLKDSPSQHTELSAGTPAEKYLKIDDYLFGYEKKSDYEKSSFMWKVRRDRGYISQELDADALAEYDPALKRRFAYGLLCGDHGKVSDPGEYIKALAAHFVEQGGEILQQELAGFDIQNGSCLGIKTNKTTMVADEYIVATGAWSSHWQDTLGVTIPLEAERGYHIEFVNPSITLRTPVMVAAGKFVINSMNGRLRCAGVVEFGGLKAPAAQAPNELLKKQMKALFPDLTYDSINEWLGHRPATTDSLPIIGASPNASNVYLGYGHHHIGLTGGPKAGRWLSQLITGQHISDDLSLYAADRKV